ncbi:MAG: GTPase Era [Holosporaceae bacterium]|jgi:GTP-binding protein Era|nr:GTPase Era [Holosporaceae bacterium]
MQQDQRDQQDQLDNKSNKKCGFVAVFGETNSGKSSLINAMVGQKVSIVSRKIQTTLTRTLGIAIRGDSQIIFVDTPGFLRQNSRESLSKIAWDAFRKSTEAMFVVDASRKNFDSSIRLLERIDKERKLTLVINKVDLVHKPLLLGMAEKFSNIRIFQEIFMTSAIEPSGIDDILRHFDARLPFGEWLYAADEITDSSFEKYTSEITREHIYHRLHQEIPYKCVVETGHYQQQEDGSVKIVQNIYVKSNRHKTIFLGAGGSKIKAIGEAARRELTELLQREVHLFLHVLLQSD